jgi:hypothetical protein
MRRLRTKNNLTRTDLAIGSVVVYGQFSVVERQARAS